MKRGRVLVAGGGGQVGRAARAAFEAAGWHVDAPDRAALDVTDPEAVAAATASARPDVIVNAAAMTDVDACETDPARAHLVNAVAVGHLAEAARGNGALLCHISTDHVFDGEAARPYREDDPVGPPNEYGRSKFAGEAAAGAGALIVRTSRVAGPEGRNTVRTILGLASDPDRRLHFVDDQHGSFTSAADLASMLVRLVEDGRTGLHHVTNRGEHSWFEIARMVLELAGQDPSRVEPIATADLVPARPARRPRRSTLDNAVLRRSGIPLLPPVEDALGRLVAEMVGASPGSAIIGDRATSSRSDRN